MPAVTEARTKSTRACARVQQPAEKKNKFNNRERKTERARKSCGDRDIARERTGEQSPKTAEETNSAVFLRKYRVPARAVSRLATVARGRRPRRRPHASPASRVAPVRALGSRLRLPRGTLRVPRSARIPTLRGFPARQRESRCLSWARCPSRRVSRPERARSSYRARPGDAASR